MTDNCIIIKGDYKQISQIFILLKLSTKDIFERDYQQSFASKLLKNLSKTIEYERYDDW